MDGDRFIVRVVGTTVFTVLEYRTSTVLVLSSLLQTGISYQ